MRIAFLGYGKEARSAQRYMRTLYPHASYVVYDSAVSLPDDAPADSGFTRDDGVSGVNVDADIIVRTPSFNPNRIHTAGKVTSVTEEFFATCPFPIVGVTGTKGKGTTASLISHILTTAGIDNYLLGNIGVPALDRLPEITAAHAAGRLGVVIYELSSFQLWDLTRSPHLAVVLMISQEHLDIHDDHAQYVSAKANIARHQDEHDLVVYYAGNSQSTAIAALSLGRKVPFDIPSDEYIMARGERVLPVADIAIPGAHNQQNVAAAVNAAMEYVADIPTIASAVRSFRGLEHRLEVVEEKDGVLYVNDSYSSAPAATVAAIRSFDKPKIIILGGKDRGLELDELTTALATANIKHLVLIGEARHRIADALRAAGLSDYTVSDDTELESIVRQTTALAENGDVVLLSPGFPSFDMFRDFTDRGEQFKGVVRSL